MKNKLNAKQKEEIIKKYGKIPSKEEVFEKIAASQEKLIAALMGAWESAPNDPKIRKDLLKAMEKAMDLRAKVYKKVIKKEPPNLIESYENLKKVLLSNSDSN